MMSIYKKRWLNFNSLNDEKNSKYIDYPCYLFLYQ